MSDRQLPKKPSMHIDVGQPDDKGVAELTVTLGDGRVIRQRVTGSFKIEVEQEQRR